MYSVGNSKDLPCEESIIRQSKKSVLVMHNQVDVIIELHCVRHYFCIYQSIGKILQFGWDYIGSLLKENLVTNRTDRLNYKGTTVQGNKESEIFAFFRY